MGEFLTREQILKIGDISRDHREAIEIAGFGRVWMQPMTAGDLDSYQRLWVKFGDDGEVRTSTPPNYKAEMVVRTLVDQDGGRMFGDDEAHLLKAKLPSFVDAMYQHARRINAVDSDEMERLEGNSAPGPSLDSASD